VLWEELEQQQQQEVEQQQEQLKELQEAGRDACLDAQQGGAGGHQICSPAQGLQQQQRLTWRECLRTICPMRAALMLLRLGLSIMLVRSLDPRRQWLEMHRAEQEQGARTITVRFKMCLQMLFCHGVYPPQVLLEHQLQHSSCQHQHQPCPGVLLFPQEQ
jgi:hypothetical protein